MSSSELERLKKLADLADQISSMADNDTEARQGIARLITRAEQDIKTKSQEIQLQKAQIGLLRHLIAALDKPGEQATAPQAAPAASPPAQNPPSTGARIQAQAPAPHQSESAVPKVAVSGND